MITLQINADGTIKEMNEKITLAFLQKAVGGYVEAIDFSHYTMWCNEEGKLSNEPKKNVIATILYQSAFNTQDWIAGDVILTGLPDAEGNTRGLSQMDSEILFPYVEAIQKAEIK